MRSWNTRPVSLSLIVVWTCCADFIFAQLAQAVSPRTSDTFPLMMNASAAMLAGFAMLVHCGMRVAWTRPLYLFLLGVGGGWLFFPIVHSLS